MTHPWATRRWASHRWLVAAAAALFLLSGCGPATSPDAPLATVPPLHPAIDDLPSTIVTLTTATGTAQVAVRVADGPDERRHGLMHVEDLPDGTGMLFLFPDVRDGGFWMKDTLVPLDIAFADADGRIVDILAMEPCEADPCPSYTPDGDYVAALEVPAGWFAQVAVTVGDHLAWEGDFDPR